MRLGCVLVIARLGLASGNSVGFNVLYVSLKRGQVILSEKVPALFQAGILFPGTIFSRRSVIVTLIVLIPTLITLK